MSGAVLGAPYLASSIAPARPSARAIPAPRSLDSSTPRVRLHLKPVQKGTKQPFAQDQIVGARVAFADVAVCDRVKQAGGTWNPEKRVWRLRYDRVVALGLHASIADESASNTRCPRPSRKHLGRTRRFTACRPSGSPTAPNGVGPMRSQSGPLMHANSAFCRFRQPAAGAGIVYSSSGGRPI